MKYNEKWRLQKLAGIWHVPLGNGWYISFHKMFALICLCYILTTIYCLKLSLITAIIFSVWFLIYMFLVFSLWYSPRFIDCLPFSRFCSDIFAWLTNSSFLSGVCIIRVMGFVHQLLDHDNDVPLPGLNRYGFLFCSFVLFLFFCRVV